MVSSLDVSCRQPQARQKESCETCFHPLLIFTTQRQLLFSLEIKQFRNIVSLIVDDLDFSIRLHQRDVSSQHQEHNQASLPAGRCQESTSRFVILYPCLIYLSSPGLHATPPGQFPERGPKPSKLSVLLYLMSIVFCCLGIIALCRYPMIPVMTCHLRSLTIIM